MRTYSCRFRTVSLSVARDLIEIAAPSDAAVVVLSAFIGQSSDAGDAQAEMGEMLIARAATSGSGGSAGTVSPLSVGDPAFGGTVEINNTTAAATLTNIIGEPFNLQAGFIYDPIPEERITISPSGILIFRLDKAPADAIDILGRVTFQEIGG